MAPGRGFFFALIRFTDTGTDIVHYGSAFYYPPGYGRIREIVYNGNVRSGPEKLSEGEPL